MSGRIKKGVSTVILKSAICIFAATLMLMLLAYLCLTEAGSPLVIGAVLALIYAVIYIAVTVLFRYIARGSAQAAEDVSPILGNMTLDYLVKTRQPVIISDEGGRIIWYNRALTVLSETRDSLFGTEISSIIPSATVKLPDDGEDETVFSHFWRVHEYPIASQKKPYRLFVLEDRDEQNKLLERISSGEPLLAYIVVDNFDELLQYVQDKYRSASSEVERLLTEWAESVDGVLAEYERDKYLFLFEAKHMGAFTESRFDILDRVRDIRVGESSLPLTVSIGIAYLSDTTLTEKEKAAQAALDMALQRGGDQVVVKTAEGMDFYGGRTKTVQKRTKVRARVMATELSARISAATNVLVMAHRNIDFDAIGASLGIARLAMYCRVKVNIVANTTDANFRRCYSHIHTLPEYRDESLFVNAADAQNMLTSGTLLVIVDVNNRVQYEAPDLEEIASSVVIIDHHRKTAEFERTPLISYIEPSASSTCELVAEILEQVLSTGMLQKEEADVMYSGILLDTKQFTRNTGVRTFGAALFLRGEGASPADAQTLFKVELSDFTREALFGSNVIIYRSVIAIAVNDSPDTQPSDRITAAKVAEKLLTVDCVVASFALCRIGDVVHISARSLGTVNVQLILEQLEGGGHYDSAATQLGSSTLEDALVRLKGAIDGYLAKQ